MAGLRQHGVVLGNRLENQPLGLTMRGSSGDNPGQVRGVGRVADLVVALENDYVASHGRSLRNPACLRMLDSVFGFKVALGLPATVTSPGFAGWVKCRCDPAVRLSTQPSCSRMRMISLIFIDT